MSILKTLSEAGAVAAVLAIVSMTALAAVVNPSAAEVAEKAANRPYGTPVFYGSR